METEKHIKNIKIKPDLSSVKIGFVDTVVSESDDDEFSNEHTVQSKYKPNKTLLNAMKKLRGFALDLLEIETDARTIKNWNVSVVKIDGNVFLQQSRVTFVLTKYVEKTESFVEIKTGQTAMYPDKEDPTRYVDHEKMAKQVEEVIAEAKRYLGGWYDEEISNQLPLFENMIKYELNITK